MEGSPYEFRRASTAHLDVIVQLVQDAAKWLRGKDTDQWAKPWPDARTRNKRVLEDLANGRTWIVWDAGSPVGTITIDTDEPVDLAGNHVWPARRRVERALYVHRVIIRRSHAGLSLGARLLDWATEIAQQEIGTYLIRIDVWTDNWDLHDYYRSQGFTLCEFRDPRALPGYPSRALFERRASPRSKGTGFAPLSECQPAESR